MRGTEDASTWQQIRRSSITSSAEGRPPEVSTRGMPSCMRVFNAALQCTAAAEAATLVGPTMRTGVYHDTCAWQADMPMVASTEGPAGTTLFRSSPQIAAHVEGPVESDIQALCTYNVVRQ
jgi:hypothetical protein